MRSWTANPHKQSDDDSIISLVKKQLNQGQIPDLKNLALYLGNLDHQLTVINEEIEDAQEKALDSIFFSIRDAVIKLINTHSFQNLQVDLFWDTDADKENLEENLHKMAPFDGSEYQAESDTVQFWQITANYSEDRALLVRATTPLRGAKDRELIENLKNFLWTLNRVELQTLCLHFFNLQRIKDEGYFDEEFEEDDEDEDDEEDHTKVTKEDLKNPYPVSLKLTHRKIRVFYNNDVTMIFSYETLAALAASRDEED